MSQVDTMLRCVAVVSAIELMFLIKPNDLSQSKLFKNHQSSCDNVYSKSAFIRLLLSDEICHTWSRVSNYSLPLLVTNSQRHKTGSSLLKKSLISLTFYIPFSFPRCCCNKGEKSEIINVNYVCGDVRMTMAIWQ